MITPWVNNEDYTKWYLVGQKNFHGFFNEYKPCFRCNERVDKVGDAWVARCKFCKAINSFFKGTPIQEIASMSEARVLFNVGGVGSGKTTISCHLFANHLRTIPNARVIAVAQTMTQLKEYAADELKKFFVDDEFVSRNASTWHLKNGSKIQFVASDRPDKLRSANVTGFWIVEANIEQMKRIYLQSLTRLRNKAAYIYEKDKDGNPITIQYPNGNIQPKILRDQTLLVVESNVTKGSWIKWAALQSPVIFYTKSVKSIPLLKKLARPIRVLNDLTGEMQNPNQITILNASIDNPVLTEEFFKQQRLGRTKEDYDREIYCDLHSEDGLVFKEVIAESNRIWTPMHSIALELASPDWVFVETLDPGGSNEGNDPTAYLLGLFNLRTKKLKFIDGFKLSGTTTNDDTFMINNIRARWGWTREKFYIFAVDNAIARSLKNNRHYSLKNDYELRLGVGLTVCDNKAIKPGIDKILNWFKADAIHFNDYLEDARQEFFSYEYINTEEKVRGTDEYVVKQGFSTKNNHVIDAVKYLIVLLEQHGHNQDQYRIDAVRTDNQVLLNPQSVRLKEKNAINTILNQIVSPSPKTIRTKIKL